MLLCETIPLKHYLKQLWINKDYSNHKYAAANIYLLGGNILPCVFKLTDLHFATVTC